MRPATLARLAPLAVAAACASAGGSGPAPVESTRTVVSTPSSGTTDLELYRDNRMAEHKIGAPPAEVWKALPAAFADVGLTGGPATGQAQTFAAIVPSIRRQLNKVSLARYLDCGTTPSGSLGAEVHLVRLQVTTSVEPDGAASRTRTQVIARATSVENSNGPVDCSSTGILEQSIAKALDARVGGVTR